MRLTTVKRRALDLAPAAGLIVLFSAAAIAEPTEPTEDSQRLALEEHLRFLASDELAGRANGSTGLEEAARYVASQFEALSLLPAGELGTYYQRLGIPVGHRVGRETKAFLRSPLETRILAHHEDFEVLTFSPEARVAAGVVFVGYGVTSPEDEYDDYAEVDVEGKIVLLLRYAPRPFDPQGWHATFVRKATNASSHGAVAVLLVNGKAPEEGGDSLVPFGVDVGAERAPIPMLHIRRDRAESLLKVAGRSLHEVRQRIDETLEPMSFPLVGVEMSVAVDIQPTMVEVDNVLGYLPPTHAERFADEHLVIGAHYDHVGLGETGGRDHRARGSIHNGADDNASGVAGVLELARMFSALSERPRGILFAAFAGEELGLKGSAHYISEPTLPLDRAVAMINLDMIGRMRHDRLYLGGLELVPDLMPVVERELRRAGLSVSGRFSAEASSDHASFIEAGIPALFFFTGLHGDYHKPTDDVQFINFEGLEQVLDVSYRISSHILESSTRPFLTSSETKPRRVAYARPDEQAAYFGVGVDDEFDGEGVRFAYVAGDGPAARAGLLAGDVLLEIDGSAVSSTAKASAVLQRLRPGETVSATVRRKDKVLQVKIKLASWP